MLQSFKNGENLKKMMPFNKNVSKAIYSQNLVCKLLKEKGFVISAVSKPTSNGIDIVAIKSNKHLLIEVKTAINSSGSWKIKKVHPHSDYIAIVFPNDFIYFESVEMWDKLSDLAGNQSITAMVNFFNLLNK